jgi:multidrug efflux pump
MAGGAALRLRDVAIIQEGAEDVRTSGYYNGKRAVEVIISRQPGANIIQTIDAVKASLPTLRAAIPGDIRLEIASDLSTTIRASLHEVELTLVVAILLVIGVVGIFLQSWRATVVPAVATTVSLLGTLGLMYLFGFSLNNLSLMALTVATGFVVDDAIVVLENIQRHIENGMTVGRRPCAARAKSASPWWRSPWGLSRCSSHCCSWGLPGRLFNQFVVTMTIAVLISLVLSLTTTPMLCALILPDQPRPTQPGAFERVFARIEAAYARLLDWAIAHRRATLALLAGAFLLQLVMLGAIPKGLFPDEDTGSILGAVRSDQAMSFQALEDRLQRIGRIIKADPGVDHVVVFTGGQRVGGGFLFVTLKEGERRASARAIVDRLRDPLSRVPGTTSFLNPVQDLRSGGRQSNAAYQYTLTSQDQTALGETAGKLAAALRREPMFADIDNDMSDAGASAFVDVSRDSAARLGITPAAINQALYDAFGQRQVSIIYNGLDQYHVVMGLGPQWLGSPTKLAQLYVPTSLTVPVAPPIGSGQATARDPATGSAISTAPATMVPLGALAHWSTGSTPTQANHQGMQSSATVSFNLAGKTSIGDATRRLNAVAARIMPPNVRGGFAGTAQTFQSSSQTLPLLVLLSIVVIYIVLGMLYESWIHPLTVLSTLPSAGLGAVAALLLLGMEFDLIAATGLILLIGIVKKNAILIIDFALAAERERGLTAAQAIREASLMRFRPILMTTIAAALGALPLAIGFGAGAELRRPLGAAIFGGLLVSQIVTLVTTPAIYLVLDRFRRRCEASQTSRSFPRMTSRIIPRLIQAIVAALLTSACSFAPRYTPPTLASPAAFKEAPGWATARPADDVAKGTWWTLFHDPVLDSLEARVAVTNANVAAAVAAYEQARAATREAKATAYPSISLSGSGTSVGSFGDQNPVVSGSMTGSGGGIGQGRRPASCSLAGSALHPRWARPGRPISGARCATAWLRPGRRHRPAGRTSSMPRFRHRANWPVTMSSFAPSMRRKRCSTTPSRSMPRPSQSPKTA